MESAYSTLPESKTELLERIRSTRDLLEDLISTLPNIVLEEPGPDGGWAIRDHLIHLAEWRWKLLAMIAGRPGYEGLQLDAQTYGNAGLDGINAILYERNRQRDTDAILADFRRAHEEVLAAIERLDPEDLDRAYDLTDPTDPRTLLDGIIANTYDHDLEHLALIHVILDSQAHI